ncbi:MAG: ribulose-phosphate 3-epimerase [bacterium]|jgi:ribulose-phosphate 3-epimerase
MKDQKVILAPSILSADFSRLGEEIAAVEKAGADIIHLDVMDGKFVPNITIGPGVVSAVKECTSLPLDVHLMIEDPDRHVDSFIKAGADMVSVHIEAAVHLHRTVCKIREGGAKSGVAVNPATDINGLRYIIDDIDFILIMSVNPGFGGQAFIPSSLEKLRNLSEMLSRVGAEVMVQVDGGIGPENAGEVVAAGAQILVAGSAIFHNPPYKDVMNRIKKAGT